MKKAEEVHEIMQKAVDERSKRDYELARDYACEHYTDDILKAAESGRSYVIVAKIKNIALRPDVVKFLQNLGYHVVNENLDQIKIMW